MDVSPTRAKTSTIASISRVEKSLSSSKLNGDENSKIKSEISSDNECSTSKTVVLESSSSKSNQPVSVSTPVSVPVPGQTKIPMKRLPISNLPLKGLSTPRGPGLPPKPQMKSSSHLSLSGKETSSKFNAPESKLNMRTHTLASFKAKPSPSLTPAPTPKSLTARSSSVSDAPGIHKRTSNISCRLPNSKAHDDSSAAASHLPKVSSTAGDQEVPPNKTARERVFENNKLRVFEDTEKRLQEIQADFMQKWESIKNLASYKFKKEYKFISFVKNDEYKLVVKEDELLKVPKKLPVGSLNDFKDKVKYFMDKCQMDFIDNLKNAEANADNKSTTYEEIYNNLEKNKELRLLELNKYVNDLIQPLDPHNDMAFVKMQTELQEAKKTIQSAEKRLSEMLQKHAEETIKLEADLKTKHDAEMIKRDIQNAELTKKLQFVEKQFEKHKKTAQKNNEEISNEQAEKAKLAEELKTVKDTNHSLSKKVNHLEQLINHEKKDKNEVKHKMEDELARLQKEKQESDQKHETELAALTRKLEESRKTAKSDHNREVGELKSTIKSLEHSKKSLEEEVEKLRLDYAHNCENGINLKRAAERISELEVVVKELETRDCGECPKEIQIEIAKLRQSETEKRREIEKLKVELSKSHFNICQLEEQVQRDQQLLEVRSELINSLQTNENSQRIHLEELFAQMGDKNIAINELKNELRTKSEDFCNVFTTLSTKQMELKRQEHMIKLLEESNERSQMLRVKQEEKIGRMEEEIAHLKQTLRHYQQNCQMNSYYQQYQQ